MKRFIVLFAALFSFSMAFGQQQSQPVPVDPAVRIGHLDNGLTYYVRHNEEPQGQANFYIAQKVGSILEEESQRGLAHFLEHMCFNGTEHFPGNGVIKYCESIGVKFGENLNAYTSIDETVYNIDNVPVANVPSSIDSCLWILHDWADGLLLEDSDIDHERGVIHEEWRTRMNSATLRMYEKILPEVYPGNKYGERMPIGLMSVVDNFPYKDLRDYYEKWYRPDQQGIIVVGDIDVDAVEAKIKEIFGTIAKPENPAERYYVQVEDNAEPIISIATDKEQAVASALIFCKHEVYPDELKNDLNYLVYTYAQLVARIMMNGRISELLQSAEPPFIDGGIDDETFFLAKTKGAWTGQVAFADNGFEKGITTLYREMLRAVRGGFTASEYERAKADVLSYYETSYNARDKKKSAEFCGEYVRHFIDNEPIPGIENMYAMAQQLIPMIPVELINQIVGSFVGQGNLVVTCMLPEREGVVWPDAEHIKAMLAAVEAENIEPYVDAVSNEPLIPVMPTAGKVTKKGTAAFGYDQYTLSNGATVYFKQTDFNKDEVLMEAYSYGGTSLYGVEEAPVLKTAGSLMTVGGVGNFSQTELIKALSGKNISVNPYISTFKEGVSASSTPKDLETMFQLTYLYFTSPRQDQDAFTSWKTRQRAVIENRQAQPMAAFQDTVSAAIYEQSSRVLSLSIPELDQIDYNRALAIAGERFADAADFVFVITGNVDEATLLPFISQYIASLPSAGKKETANAEALNFVKGVRNISFDKKMEIPMATNLFFDHSTPDYTLKNALSYDIALNALSTVLLEEIREKEGGTYGIGAYGEMGGFPVKEAYHQIAYQTDPDKCEYLNGRVREIVAEFASNGPSEENMSKAKEFFLKNYKENLRENSYWTKTLTDYLDSGVDCSTDFEKVLESISVKDVRDIFKSVMEENNHLEIIMKGVAQ